MSFVLWNNFLWKTFRNAKCSLFPHGYFRKRHFEKSRSYTGNQIDTKSLWMLVHYKMLPILEEGSALFALQTWNAVEFSTFKLAKNSDDCWSSGSERHCPRHLWDPSRIPVRSPLAPCQVLRICSIWLWRFSSVSWIRDMRSNALLNYIIYIN